MFIAIAEINGGKTTGDNGRDSRDTGSVDENRADIYRLMRASRLFRKSGKLRKLGSCSDDSSLVGSLAALFKNDPIRPCNRDGRVLMT